MGIPYNKERFDREFSKYIHLCKLFDLEPMERENFDAQHEYSEDANDMVIEALLERHNEEKQRKALEQKL